MEPITTESLMSPSLTELLREHLPSDTLQKSIAMDWIASVRKPGRRDPAGSYVESRLSRCISADPAAVRYFFGDRERAIALLDAMKVTGQARETILAAADAVLNAKGEAPARLIVDLTPWFDVQTAKQLFEQLRTLVVEPALLRPALLLLTPSLYDALPRSFDAAKWLRVEEVDQAEAASRVAELTGDGVLLVSAAPNAHPERWVAAEYDEHTGALTLDPADGLSRFAHDGRLSFPEITHDLAAHISDDGQTFDVTALSPIARRRAMVGLRDRSLAEQIAADPQRRLAMARALGITATATERDRVESELRAIAMTLGLASPETRSKPELEDLLARARRRLQSETIVRVEDEIHIVNPTPTHAAIAHPRIRTYTIDSPEPQIKLLREAIADWTIGDFETDPTLAAVMERLDPERRDVLAMLHARAWLFASQRVTPRPARLIEDWRAALAGAFTRPVPPALVRLRTEPAPPYYGKLELHALRPVGYVTAELSGIEQATAESLRYVAHPPALQGLPIDRRSAFHLLTHREPSWPHSNGTRLVLPDPSQRSEMNDSELDQRWLDAYDAFLARTPFYKGIAKTISVEPPSRPLSWTTADELLATSWLALQSAVDHGPAVRSSDGAVLLSLGGGLAAKVDVRETATDVGSLRAMVDVSPLGMTYDVSAGVTGVEYKVPLGIVLLQGRMRAAITYTASPLLIGQGVSPALRASTLPSQEPTYEDDD